MNHRIPRHLPLTSLLLTLAMPLTHADDKPPAPGSADDALYVIGLSIGQQLHDNGVRQVPVGRLEQGVKDGLRGKQAVGADQMRVQAFLRDEAHEAAVRNSAAAHDFLARNAKSAGVKTTASGLQYRIIQSGSATAASPLPTDQVTVNFRGTLLDGNEFDSSKKPGTYSTLQVNGLMRAWTEALTLMKPGDHWQLWVPPELGFGTASRAGVPGGSLLIYDLQLLNVTPAIRPSDASNR